MKVLRRYLAVVPEMLNTIVAFLVAVVSLLLLLLVFVAILVLKILDWFSEKINGGKSGFSMRKICQELDKLNRF